jgi:hypothetical protein
MKTFAVYQNNEMICCGTAEDCCIELGISLNTFRHYSSKSYTQRKSQYKDKRNGYTIVKQEMNQMNCPICEKPAKMMDSRTTKYKITHRQYECEHCFTIFKTQEKIDFESIPKYLRDKYLTDGSFK